MDTLLDHGEVRAVVALAAPLGAAPALEADQALVHGLAPPLVVDPDAAVILVQVDRRVTAGLARVAAVRLEGGDGGATRDERIPAELGAFLPCGSAGRAASSTIDCNGAAAGNGTRALGVRPPWRQRRTQSRVTTPPPGRKQRPHQASFRDSVLADYDHRCAISNLPDNHLLDAAHIMADAHELLGQPVIANGIALSKIHQAAFDSPLIGINP